MSVWCVGAWYHVRLLVVHLPLLLRRTLPCAQHFPHGIELRSPERVACELALVTLLLVVELLDTIQRIYDGRYDPTDLYDGR
jgi:hypothetical protein